MSREAIALECYKKIDRVIKALELFKSHEDCLFNISKLANMLNITGKELKEILAILFQFQHFLIDLFHEFRLQSKWRNNETFLKMIPKDRKKVPDELNRKEIIISARHSRLLSDIIRYFMHVSHGKGFDITRRDSDLTANVKELYNYHPNFFRRNGYNLLYPSGLAIEFGTLLKSYHQVNKPLKTVRVVDYQIKINYS